MAAKAGPGGTFTMGGDLTVTYVGINGTNYTSSATAPINAGDYEASASFAGDTDHTGSSGSAGFTISQATLTVTGITANNKPYDGSKTATLTTVGAALVGVALASTSNAPAATNSESSALSGDALAISANAPTTSVSATLPNATIAASGGTISATNASQYLQNVTLTSGSRLNLNNDFLYLNTALTNVLHDASGGR